MAGSNKSSLLRDAGKSIPTGTLGAIISTGVLFVVMVCLAAAVIPRDTLKEDKAALATYAWPNSLVTEIGIFVATIGAALQSMSGAPLLLKAIANDKVIICFESAAMCSLLYYVIPLAWAICLYAVCHLLF